MRPDRPSGPRLSEDVTGKELDIVTQKSLTGLTAENATYVARHLVMSGRLLEEDPELAWQHAQAAQRRGGRVAVVREAAAVAAYGAGHFREALAELRTARRMSGDDGFLPMMADCERGLGRPERALDLATSPEAARLDEDGRIEMLIVASGARRDLGQAAAAVVGLQVPELRSPKETPWRARLLYAYSEALADAGRAREARDWLERAAVADVDGETDAAERLDELAGYSFSEEDLPVPTEPSAQDDPPIADDDSDSDADDSDDDGSDDDGSDDNGSDGIPDGSREI